LPLATAAWIASHVPRFARAERSTVASLLSDAAFDGVARRGVVVQVTPETAFRAMYAQTVEGERPDVTVIPAVFVRYAGIAEWLVARDEGMWTWVVSLSYGEPLWGGAVTSRDAWFELDPALACPWPTGLVPDGLLAHRRPAMDGVVDAGLARFEALIRDVQDADRGLGTADEYLAWRAAIHAATLGESGSVAAARRALQLARRLDADLPTDALAAALDDEPRRRSESLRRWMCSRRAQNSTGTGVNPSK
jgi:hypothetical protein